MLTRRSIWALVVVLAAGVGLAAAASIAGAAPRASDGAAAKQPQWQILSTPVTQEWDVLPVAYAAGRVWLGFGSASGHMRVGSIRPSRGKLRYVNAGMLRTRGRVLSVTGPEIVYHISDISGQPGPLRSARLFADGRLGEPEPVSDAPESLLPAELHPSSIDRVSVGERTVWLVAGGRSSEGPSGGITNKGYLWACCTDQGEPVSLNKAILKRAPGKFRMAVDERGRIWLAWVDNENGRFAQLDPDTLLPGKVMAIPGASGDTVRIELACAETCRTVYQDDSRIVSWAPGDRAGTLIAKGPPHQGSYPILLAAAYRSGRLIVAHTLDAPNYSRTGNTEARVVRGNERGAGAKVVGSVLTPSLHWPKTHGVRVTGWNPVLYYGERAVFTPRGVMVFQIWQGGASAFAGTRFTGAFIPCC